MGRKLDALASMSPTRAAVALRDFDGSSLNALLDSAARTQPTVATALPLLHAIGATRTCINLKQPTRKQFFWKGKSDGVWFSYQLIREKGRSRRSHADPCETLNRYALPQANDTATLLRGSRREEALDLLDIPAHARNSISEAALRARLMALEPAPPSAHFLLRRRLKPRRGSVLALGHRANLDVNRYTCPPHRLLIGCTGPDYEAPFLGAFVPDMDAASEWVDRIPAAPPFKYCRRTGTGGAEQPNKRISGVALLLPELHANINVGHAVKDLVFLAHVLAEQRAARGTNGSFAISTVIVDDKATATGNLSSGQQGFRYRQSSLEALISYVDPSIHIVYMQQGAHRWREDFGHVAQWQGASSVCFDIVLQKGFAYATRPLSTTSTGTRTGTGTGIGTSTTPDHAPLYPLPRAPPLFVRYAGDWRGAGLFRDSIYAMCDINPTSEADSVLLVVHGLASSGKTTRRWHDQLALITSIRRRAFRSRGCGAAPTADCRPLRLLVRAMEGLSFCEQAALYARSKVVLTHHGASLANGYFLREGSIMVEMNRQWRVTPTSLAPDTRGTTFAHTFDGAGYAGLFLSSHVAYIGARVTYGVWPTSARAGRNDGRIDPRTGAVRWLLHERIKYDFNDPNMEIGVNSSRCPHSHRPPRSTTRAPHTHCYLWQVGGGT